MIMAKNNENSIISDDREFSRVDTCIPFEFSLVQKEECVNIRSRISTSPSIISSPMPELEDEALATYLKTINNKLDAVLNHIIFQKEGFLSLKMRPANISGGGMSFTSNQNYQLGDVLEIKMMLNVFQPIAMYLYGKVVATGAVGPDRKFDTSVRFIEMDDEIANAIVRYVFEVQRGQIRKRRE